MDRSGTVGTHAGVPVSEERSLTLPAVFCAVNLQASHLAMLPCPVMQRLDPQTTEKRPEHRVHGAISLDPNPEQAAFALRRTWHLHTALWGNGRLEIQRDGENRFKYLWPLLPDRTETVRLDRSDELAYRVTRKHGQRQLLSAENVLHVAGLSYEGIDGYGLIRHLARENMGLGLAIAQYAQSFFGNNAVLGTILTSDQPLPEEVKANLQASFEQTQRGSGKAFRTYVVDGAAGLKVSHFSRTNEESQTVEQLTYAIQDVARWLGIPPPLLMELSKGTFTNITELGRWYIKFFLAQWFKPYEQEITRKLFTRKELDDGYFVEYVAEGLLRGDTSTRYEAYASALDRGWMNRDEVRLKENMNPLPDGRGQEFLEPLNMGPAGGRTNETGNALSGGNGNPTLARQRIAAAHEPVFTATLERMDKVETTGLARASKSKDLRQWSERFYTGHTAKLRDAMGPLVDAMTAALRATLPKGTEADWSLFIGRFTRDACDAHIAMRRAGEDEPGNLAQRLLAEAVEEFDDEQDV